MRSDALLAYCRVHQRLLPGARYFVRKPPIHDHAGVSRWTRGLDFDLSRQLHIFFMFASSEGSGVHRPA